MKASDLRIGNFVEYNGMYLTVSEIYTPKPRKPKQFDAVECVELLCDGFITATMDEIKPIPLTEEILLKCGFQQRKELSNFYYLELNDWTRIYVAFHGINYGIEISVSKHSYCPNIKYLHQLQNLCHALIGEELNVEL